RTTKKPGNPPSRTMPPAIPNTPEMNEARTMVEPITASEAAVMVAHAPDRASRLSRPRQRTVDHIDGVLKPVDRDEGAEARSLLLAEQHLVEHVEPIQRDAGLAILGRLFLIKKRRPAPHVVEHVLNFVGRRGRRKIGERVTKVEQRLALFRAGITELLLRQDEGAIVVYGVLYRVVQLRMSLRRHTRPVTADEAPKRIGILGI